ncbi:unnamed protein product [Nezara viridula]|uniref:PHD-type domain-containing protein n=1 Tax=Nezara viridula TaxID=85310 RepID=A0A9P0EDM5_NEZVI|nr:unnamed protein product [Nezara viridula]
MVDTYTRHAIRVSVAQICQIIGWTSIHSSPLEILTDILQEYIFNLSKIASNYAMLYGQTEPNMNHLALAFKDMGISLIELEEYVTYVETSSVLEVPKYPIPKESHLNHLKPGSREVVTRPVHIHEHLPPMHPHLEDRDYILSKSPLSIDITTSESLSPLSSPKSVFKKPGDPVINERRSRPLLDDNEVRPLREISSVMMTTSGFLSPAREGKLPEARTVPIEFNRSSLSPEDSNLVEQNIELKIDKKKKPKIPDIKKLDKENKIKEENRDQRETEDEFKGKKLLNSKETSKLKALKTGAQKMPSKPPSPSPILKKPKVQLSPTASQASFIMKPQKEKSPKSEKKPPSPPNKDLFVPSLPISSRDLNSDTDVKLPSEPDKQKLNILKKISKVKEEPEDSKNSVADVRENSSFSFDQVPHSTLINKKIINDNSSLGKEYEDELETPIDVENASPPGNVEYNRLPPPDLPKITEVQKIPEVKKKKKDKKEKRDMENDRDSYCNSQKSKNQLDDSGKSKQSSATHDISFPEETQTPSFPNLTCPVPPAPGLIPWSNPLFSTANPVSPALNLMNYTNFPKKSQDIPTTTVQQPSFSSTFTTNSSHTLSGTAPLPPFSNKDNTVLLSKKKERKREKKLKEKMKKKKEKKEKNRSKDKSVKKKLKLEKKEREKLKIKKEKKEKKKEKELASEERSEVNTVPKITFKLGPVSPKDSSAESCTRKIVIKPIIKKEENENVAEANPYVVPDIQKTPSNSNTIKTKSSKAGKSHFQMKPEIPEKPPSFSCAPVLSIPKPETVSSITKWDGDANQQMWICPACMRPDDGSPMIACDLCDYWFHWTCVGIQEAIESDWYCELCVLRREEGCSEKKKKHRKKKT